MTQTLDQPELTPSDIANDDLLRSTTMKRLIASELALGSEADASVPPRVLVQFWDDSTTVPDDVRQCIESWLPLEGSGFTRLLFDDVSAKEFIAKELEQRYSEAFSRCQHPAMRADYFRLCYMLRFGGFYVDADDIYLGQSIEPYFRDGRLKLQSLCYDIAGDSMLDPLLSAQLPDQQTNARIFYVNNNPVIAAANHPVVVAALERSTRLLLADSAVRDIQSVTGPGNLTMSLVEHALRLERANQVPDFVLLNDWEAVARSEWPLAYRSDLRNWRNWVRDPRATTMPPASEDLL